MEILLYISLFFLLLYIIFLLKPEPLEGKTQLMVGLFYFIFCLLFLMVIYLYKSSIWLVLLAIPILFIAQYPMQIITGAIVRAILKAKKQI